MSVILMTTLFYKALILQEEIWCWSLLGLKWLRPQDSNGPAQGIKPASSHSAVKRSSIWYTG